MQYAPNKIRLDEGTESLTDPRVAGHSALANRVGEHLERHYPGHFWKVDVPVGQGVVKIQIPVFMRRLWMVIKIHELKSDPGLTSITRAGGEILERYGLGRSGFVLDDFLALRQRAPQIHLCANGWIPD